MKILLLGEYSNVHATLAKGLRSLGHEVTVASDGDNWKNYPRDINLRRRWNNLLGGASYLPRLLNQFRHFRGYDVVQLINPVFLPLRAERIAPFYRYLRRHNGKVFLGAFGMDHYWVRAGLDCTTFRYSDFNIGCRQRLEGENKIFIRDWLDGAKGILNRYVAKDCDGIIAGLYEYYASYAPHYKDKLTYIPFPIQLPQPKPHALQAVPRPIRFFIGIQRSRSRYKGTDIMLRALERVAAEYPRQAEIVRVESVPFAEYCRLMNGSHVILDQLYSYTPAMNALEAMARGIVVVGGGEPEHYELLQEPQLRPIINVDPTESSVYNALKALIEHPERLPQLSADSIEYIRRHYDHVKVAQRYLDFWNRQ